jgi:hypothetical protein
MQDGRAHRLVSGHRSDSLSFVKTTFLLSKISSFFKDLNICFSTLFEIYKAEFKRKLITYQAAILFFNFHMFTHRNMYLLHAGTCSKILTFI